MITLVAISGFGLGIGLPGDAVGGIGLGLLVGGTVLLVFGSPMGYPNRAAVTVGLGDLGLRIADLELAPDRSWGVRRLTGSLDDGTRIEVKAYGQDAVGSQRISRAWRALWYRDVGQTYTSNRLQAVEHEALAILTAQGSGVATPEILAVGLGGELSLARTPISARLPRSRCPQGGKNSPLCLAARVGRNVESASIEHRAGPARALKGAVPAAQGCGHAQDYQGRRHRLWGHLAGTPGGLSEVSPRGNPGRL